MRFYCIVKGTASSHYRLGRRIVEKSSEAGKDRCGASDSSVERLKHLAAAFNVFGRGGRYYWNEYDRAIPGHALIEPSIPRSLPTIFSTFSSFTEADMRLGSIVNLGEETRNQIVKVTQDHVRRTHGNLLDPVVSFCLENCLSKSIDIPSSLQHRLEEAKLAHTQWLHMLRTYASQKGSTSNQILLLTQIRFFASWLLLSTCRETQEVSFDRFESEDIRVLDQAKQYFRYTPGQALPTRPPQLREPISLSLEGGILPALHLIACKSRPSPIRRRAATMVVNADRLEGTCYSGTIGLIVGCVADLEGSTQALRADPMLAAQAFSSDQVPEEARIADLAIESVPVSSPPLFKLACARYLYGRDEQIEVKVYRGEGLPIDLRLGGSRVFDCARARAEDCRVLLSA